MKIGAQLYTVRDACKTKEGLAETLRRVADMGYTAVQLSGVCPYEADWMAAQLASCGLTAPITHFDYRRITEDTEATIAFHRTMDTRYIGLGSIPNFKKEHCSMDIFDRYVEQITPAVKKIHAAGLKFMYHNHNMEFIRLPDGHNLLEKMCELFLPEEYGITLDTYWVMAGGADPVFWLRELRGRLNCVHFKDMVYDAADLAVRMAPIGQGNMNYPAIVKACEDSGVEYGFVEQDHCYDQDPFDCLKKSLDYFRSLGLDG